MEKNTVVKKIIFIVGITALAVSSGAAAAALVANYFVGSISIATPSVSFPARPALSVNGTKVSESVRSAVSLYKKRAGTTPLDKVFLPADEVGAGLVLTSDGWIVTSASVIIGHDQLIAVFADKTTSLIDATKAVHDEATGIVYIKTEGQHLTVASFGDDATLHPSDPVFLADSSAVKTSAVLAARRLTVSIKTDYIESTERLGRRIAIDSLGLSGAPVVDASGLIIGVNMGDGTVVPASFVTQVLRSLFKDGQVIRPRAGLRFISLDNLPNAKDAGLATTGALVTGGGKYVAVLKGSAAEAAGLIEGDVIVSIERDRINDEATLSERLQDYVPGSKVELIVIRNGKQLKLEMTLK